MPDDPTKFQCSCLEKLSENVKKAYGEDAHLCLSCYVDHSDPEAEQCTMILGFEPLFFKYREGKKVRKAHIGLKFCPMCGNKFE